MGMHLSVILQIEGLNVLLKAERGHRPEQVVDVDDLALLPLALVARPAENRRNKTATGQHQTTHT